jgi:hypothetical protein
MSFEPTTFLRLANEVVEQAVIEALGGEDPAAAEQFKSHLPQIAKLLGCRRPKLVRLRATGQKDPLLLVAHRAMSLIATGADICVGDIVTNSENPEGGKPPPDWFIVSVDDGTSPLDAASDAALEPEVSAHDDWDPEEVSRADSLS